MALTPEQIDALPTYTASQQLKMWHRASVEVAGAGVSYSVSGRSLTKANASEILRMIQHWEEQVALEEAGTNGGNVLVKYGERV